MRDNLGADIAAGAGLIIDDELLAKPLRQPIADQPRIDVGCRARAESRQ